MAEGKEKANTETRNEILDSGTRQQETGEIKDVGNVEIRLPHEVRSWMEKVEQAGTSGQQVVNDDNGQPLMKPASPADPRIQLPVTKKKFVEGFKKKIDEAGKWLSTFLFKMIKLKKGSVKFQEE